MMINTHYAQHLPLHFFECAMLRIIYFVLNAAENYVVFLKLKKKSLFQLLLHT